MKAIPLEVSCPCCETLLKVDPKNGEVLAYGEDAKNPTDLGDVVERVEKREEKLNDSFGAAMQAERQRKQELADLFKKATEKAKDDDDNPSGPRNPLDDRWR